jgi:hypothetical protein
MTLTARIIIHLALFASFTVNHAQISPSNTRKNKQSLESVASKHKQIYDMSCIPMSVEMLLKYNDCVAPTYYRLQDSWKNKVDGTFENFDGRIVACLKFKHQFNVQRGNDFPFKQLFKTIDTELSAGRKVIVSLPSGLNLWHMYVIDKKMAQGDYVAFSRYYNDNKVIRKDDVKKSIYNCEGTDILTYTIAD